MVRLVLIGSGRIKKVLIWAFKMIPPLVFVMFIRKLPLGRWKGFRDEIPIFGFDSLAPRWKRLVAI